MRTEFLEKLPKLHLHYCRASTSKLYLEPTTQNWDHLYRLYKEKCDEHLRTHLCCQVLHDECEKMKIGIFHPGKDQCDTCVAHDAGNMTDEEWNIHISQKYDARREKKTNDKMLAEDSSKLGYDGEKTLVLCMDLQAVLLSPRLKASALYYKTKIAVHNFTLFNHASSDVTCYVWHEGEAELTASEFASCVNSYLLQNLKYDVFILHSDGCTYQNRYVVMANTLLHFAQVHKTVIQKVLEKGHTQMEVNSVHATIERKLQHSSIYCPADYVYVMKNARKHPRPYHVKFVDHTFFRDFATLKALSTIRPGRKTGDLTVTDLRCVKYTSEGVQYKLLFNDSWTDLPRLLRPQDVLPASNPPLLYGESRMIKDSKYNHLQQLKTVMPSDYHAFCDQLRH